MARAGTGLETSVVVMKSVSSARCTVILAWGAEKLAPTSFAAFIVTMQVGWVPEQTPDQPPKTVGGSEDAVRRTIVPGA